MGSHPLHAGRREPLTIHLPCPLSGLELVKCPSSGLGTRERLGTSLPLILEREHKPLDGGVTVAVHVWNVDRHL